MPPCLFRQLALSVLLSCACDGESSTEARAEGEVAGPSRQVDAQLVSPPDGGVLARALAEPSLPPASPDSPRDPSSLELTFVGDIIFGRYREHGFDPIPEGGFAVFEPLREQLRSDLLIGNLETPLTETLPRHSPMPSRFAFGASREHARSLVAAGFDAVTLANNHWYDLRDEGLESSPAILRDLEITPLGSALPGPERFRVETLERDGWRIGIIAITNRTNYLVPEETAGPPYLATRHVGARIGPMLRDARPHHDLLLVLVHWGEEYEDMPGQDQIEAGRALIDAGADVVVGHHPHVLQGVEVYRGGVIAYSLGNFLFENTGAKPRQTGVLRVRMQREPRCLERVVFHPAFVTREPVTHPVPATGRMGALVRGRMQKLSATFGSQWSQVGDDLEFAVSSCSRIAAR